ncbi:MAG: hydrogenase maturation protein [Hyphomicrobiaceae bacterium]|nr:hydrogenase maturation protein [Hyphomicrobiaceae bacterium]
MRILLLCHSFNSLTQRLYVELVESGHEVSVEFDINDEVTIEAVALFRPEIVVAPFLKRAIPAAVWEVIPCLVVHPGPPGDRGPSALDWAIMDGAKDWGVTVLQATGEFDAGPVWAWQRFAMRRATKSSLYRNEVTEAAVAAVGDALRSFESGLRTAPDQRAFDDISPRWRNAAKQSDRVIRWSDDDTDAVLRKFAASDGTPGVKDQICGQDLFLFDAHRANVAAAGAAPGAVIARSHRAILRATRDGAVWIGQARLCRPKAIKLPAARVLAEQVVSLPQIEGPRDVFYEEEGDVGFLHFPFLNGAMGVDACRRLLMAFRDAAARPVRVLVLMGGPDFWSNGLDLNEIEAAASPADQSWHNINAIDDIAEQIVRTTDKIVVSALCGNAGAGGVFLARAADEVWLRRGVILNPHYKDMGNLYGSELWTYLLPRHVGSERARQITQQRQPMGTAEALRLGLASRIVDAPRERFAASVATMARGLATDPGLPKRLAEKHRQREADEAKKPLADYRTDELKRMRRNFYGFDPSYHVARYNFVHKVPKSRTPVTIAHHRNRSLGSTAAVEETAK